MGKRANLVGEKINNWLVKEYKGVNKFHQTLWLVECDCNKHTERIKTHSEIKQTKSCGCLDLENLNGQTFGRWRVISNPIIKNDNKVYFLCECECNKHTTREVRADRLKNGSSQSCGCYATEQKTKHGLSRERITNIWYGMIDRCTNPNRNDYERYGGRGISVCDEWKENKDYSGLKNFYKWAINNGYEENLTIERKDVNGNYEPNNCEWITMEEQAKNKTNTIYINIDGKNEKLIDLADIHNIKRETLLKRYNNGIEDKELLLTPKNLHNTSGIIGVSYSSDQHNWRAFINVNKKRYELGRRKNKDEAIVLRLKAEKKYFGENALQSYLFAQYGIEVDA
jgi:hypothetical protein